MIILTIRTDKPEAELGIYDGQERLAYETWQAHRQLAETIHIKISEILGQASVSMKNIEGIIVFEGPGSFTGLRIGMAVANALAYAQNVPIVAAAGKQWVNTGIKKLAAGQDDKIALPKYGQRVKTSKLRK